MPGDGIRVQLRGGRGEEVPLLLQLQELRGGAAPRPLWSSLQTIPCHGTLILTDSELTRRILRVNLRRTCHLSEDKCSESEVVMYLFLIRCFIN